ncbi:MAG TPA: ABC transporter permease [Bryobacteraceae bacterium]|nr:ABC transporter permease [Bryobacteraceae bacterium]
MLPSIRQAFRVLRKDEGFTAVAICSLAIGIGATSSMFSFADSMLLRPLPVQEPGRVLAINTAIPAAFGDNPAISYPDYIDLRDRNRSFDGLVAASYSFFSYSPDSDALPRVKWGLYVSGNFFHVLGVEPTVGRGFNAEEDRVAGRDPVVVLGHDFWVSQFGGDPGIVGSPIRLNGVEFSVIGVAPEHFTGIDLFMRPQVYVPLTMSPRMGPRDSLVNRDFGWLFVKGRLKPGAGLPQAQSDIGAISKDLQKLHGAASRDQRLVVQTELQFRATQSRATMELVTMLGLLGICVLLVACANVAGLLLSRARARSREIAVRLAIGAGRAALVRQFLLENLLVAIAGGVGGSFLAEALAAFWKRMPIPTDVPVVWVIEVDRRVLLFTLAISVLSTVLFGLAPALRATRPNLVPALKAADADSGGRRRLWGRNTIVAGQVALSVVLLAVSAALMQGFREQLLPGPGYRVDRLFLTTIDTRFANYTPEQASRFFQNLLDRTRSAPGVRSAALTFTVPMMSNSARINLVPQGWQLPRGERAMLTIGTYISEGYFETMNVPILRGRDLLQSDGEHAPLVAVVNEQMANHYWKGDAVGKRFHLDDAEGPLVEIVGVARQSKVGWIVEPLLDYVYLPYRQHASPRLSLVAESAARDAGAIAPVVRDAVRTLDRDMPLFDVRTMQDLYSQRGVKTSNMILQNVLLMGLMGMVLAAVGLYGLVAYAVSRRTTEIGIRMALGAERRAVVWMVLRQGLRLGGAGVTVGLALAIFVCRGVGSTLAFFAFGHISAMAYIGVPLLLLVVTAVASWAPARRASHVDPLTSLRDL